MSHYQDCRRIKGLLEVLCQAVQVVVRLVQTLVAAAEGIAAPLWTAGGPAVLPPPLRAATYTANWWVVYAEQVLDLGGDKACRGGIMMQSGQPMAGMHQAGLVQRKDWILRPESGLIKLCPPS